MRNYCVLTCEEASSPSYPQKTPLFSNIVTTFPLFLILRLPLRSFNLEDVRRIYDFLLDISGDVNRIIRLKHQVTKMMPQVFLPYICMAHLLR